MRVLGGFFALLAAATFAWTNAAARRGVLSGTVAQGTTLSLPVGVPIFFAALLFSGHPAVLIELPGRSILVFAAVGISHFCIGRYCNYRAIHAIGTNLAGPVMQFNLVVSLTLAIFFLGEMLTPLRILGILLIMAGPAVVSRGQTRNRGVRARSDAKPVPVPDQLLDGLVADGAAAPATAKVVFTPRLAEGYVFAFLAAICYGASPALVRYAVNGQGLTAGLAGGVIASAAATIVVLFMLLAPGYRREVRAVNPEAAKWFLYSAMLVYVSQIFAYMAVSIAPVTVTAPIIALNNVFRLHFSRWLNPDHEVFGREVILATALAFLGVVVLSASAETLPLPAAWSAFLGSHWP